MCNFVFLSLAVTYGAMFVFSVLCYHQVVIAFAPNGTIISTGGGGGRREALSRIE